MNKFQDGFSNNSYDDLLAEYSGDTLTNNPVETPAPQRKDFKPSTQRYNAPIRRNQTNQPVAKRTETSFEDDLSNAFRSTSNRPAPSRRNSGSTHYGASNSYSEPQHRGDRFNVNINFNPNEYGEEPVNNENNFLDKIKRVKKEKSGKEDNMKPTKKTTKTSASKNSKKKSNAKIFVKRNGKLQFNVDALKLGFVNFFKARAKGLAVFAVCIVLAVVISLCALSCINDVLAINREYEEIEIVLPNGADTKEAIKILDESGLIKNKTFCYLFAQFMGISDEGYLPGVYKLSPDMGVEKMLLRFKTTVTKGRMIEIVVPEGFTVDQIFARLEKNKICSASSLYKVLETIDFSEEYSFIAKIDDAEDRYHVLEGYMYPATYEFEQGADPASVIRQFLNKFQNVWTEEYSAKAKELGMSMDEVITLASIIEKEGNSQEQFKQISSVLHNRLNSDSAEHLVLKCDSTVDYVENYIHNRVHTDSERNKYRENYNTYVCWGLPVGAICNPGKASIEAALNPPKSNNYFFQHDKNGKIYLAETGKQHEANKLIVEKVDGEG